MTPAPFLPRQPPERGTRVGVQAIPVELAVAKYTDLPVRNCAGSQMLQGGCGQLGKGCGQVAAVAGAQLDGACGSLGQHQAPAVDLQFVGQLRLTLQRSALTGDVVDWPGQRDLDRSCRWGKRHRLSSVDTGLGNPAVRGLNMMTSESVTEPLLAG
jgi:hypothetical protein